MAKVDSKLPSCFAASLNPRLDKKEGGNMGTASLIRYQNVLLDNLQNYLWFYLQPTFFSFPGFPNCLFIISYIADNFLPFQYVFYKRHDKSHLNYHYYHYSFNHCSPSFPPQGFPEYSEASRGLLDVPSSSQCSERK